MSREVLLCLTVAFLVAVCKQPYHPFAERMDSQCMWTLQACERSYNCSLSAQSTKHKACTWCINKNILVNEQQTELPSELKAYPTKCDAVHLYKLEEGA